jgi:hypothetical protein
MLADQTDFAFQRPKRDEIFAKQFDPDRWAAALQILRKEYRQLILSE